MKKKFYQLILSAVILTSNSLFAMDAREGEELIDLKLGASLSKPTFIKGQNQKVNIDWFLSFLKENISEDSATASTINFRDLLEALGSFGISTTSAVPQQAVTETNSKSAVQVDLDALLGGMQTDIMPATANSGNFTFDQKYLDPDSPALIMCQRLERPIDCEIEEQKFIMKVQVFTRDHYVVSHLTELNRESPRSLNLEALKPESTFSFNWKMEKNQFEANIIIIKGHHNDLTLDTPELINLANNYMMTTPSEMTQESYDPYFRKIMITLTSEQRQSS